jgi:hypothetical protein
LAIRMRSWLSLFLIVSVLSTILAMFVYPTTEANATEKASTPSSINGFDNRCKYNPVSDGQIPSGVKPCNVDGYKFNSKFYYQTWTLKDSPLKTRPARNLVVYGEPASVKGIQGFKTGWQPTDPNSRILNEGHFSNPGGGTRGEYRYLGFTEDGSVFSNVHFIVDSDSGNALPTKHWVIDPWAELPNNYKYLPNGPGSIYRDFRTGRYDNVMLPKFEKIRNVIGRSIGFSTITQGVKYSDRYTVLPNNNTNIDPRNYMSIDQAPTTREGGFGNMYHYSWDTHSLWYHTFALQKLSHREDKDYLSNACTVTPLTKAPIPLGKSSSVSVQVKITGSIEDKLIIGSDQGEALFYNRKDVSNWYLKYITQDNQVKYITTANKAHGVILNDNTASGLVTLVLDTNKFNKDNDKLWKYTLQASASSIFYNHTASAPSEASADCSVELTFKAPDNGPMLSDFNVMESISFERKSDFTGNRLGYQDASYGDDVDYYNFEITNVEDGTKVNKIYDPAIPGIKKPKAGYLDQEAVNAWLLAFIKSKFANETTLTPVTKTFTITQTIADKEATINHRSSATRNVIVIQYPQKPYVPGCETVAHINPAPAQFISPETSWPEDWWDVVPMPVTDAAPEYVPHRICDAPASYDDFTKKVYVDDKEINASDFFSGNYVFGEAATGVRKVTVTYTAPDGNVSHITQHMVIHESKPYVGLRFEGLYKGNRTMKATNVSVEYNDKWAESTAPMAMTSFSFVNHTDSNLKCRTGFCESNLQEKMFMYKAAGNYKMSMSAKRVITYGNGQTITRYSDPYEVEYEIQPDHKPAIIAHAYGSQISRIDQLELNYQVDSTDGDFIASRNLKIFYDANNDGTFEQKVYETNGALTELPRFAKLGQYQIVADAKEGTNQDRLMEFITPADDKTQRSYAYFFIDNYAPSSDLYLDIPSEKQDMDIYFLLDSKLPQASTDYILGHKVTIANQFTTSNMLANIGIWDMKTYTYNQPASTSRDTGTTYPASAISYSSNGYSGTLPLTSVSNPQRRVDEGGYVAVPDSKVETGSCTNVVTTSYNQNGYATGNNESNPCPGSMSYNSGGFSGTLSRLPGASSSGSCPSSNGPKGGTCSVTWTASYSGTVWGSKQVWQEKWVWYDDYTGYYAGLIYKDIRQPYNPAFMRAVPNKYVIYISDATVAPSDLADLQMVMRKQDAKLIVVGNDDIRAQITNDHFVPNNKAIDQVIAEVIAYIADNNPATPRVFKLLGEPIETRTAAFDPEGDPLPAATDLMQIIQDPNYYDNSMGYDKFAGKTLTSAKLAANWTPYQSIVALTKPGKYQFFRKIKDQPTTDPNFPGYAYDSNESAIEVFVHRKPIADVVLDFDYIAASNTYKTTWIDLSYDLDHNITRAATDRGIRARTIKFTNTGTNEVFTAIPDSLPPGTYKLDYMAQDIEGVWSDPVERTFVLPDAVPVQMKSNLKTAYSGFSLNSVPASEGLTAYQLWTRYPYSISLGFQMGSYISGHIPYYTGTKNGNDISWRDETFTIPATTPDGAYTFTITGNGSAGGARATQNYTVKVVTPIQLTGQIDGQNGGGTNVSTLVVSDSYNLVGRTSKYANAVTVTAFKGTSYQRSLALAQTTINSTGYGAKAWSTSLTAGAIPDGKYTFEWRATSLNGNVETVSKVVDIVNNRPPTGDFDWLPKPVYEGDLVQFKTTVNDADRDALDVVYEITSPVSGSQKQTFTYKLAYPYASTAPAVKMDTVGNWTVKMTVSDGRAAPVVITKSVAVLPLTITGRVKHTAEWDKLRQSFNMKESGKLEQPRGYSMFWAGEKFLLEANTTATGTITQASRVEVRMGGRSYLLKPTNAALSSWGSELWEEAFSKLPNGTLSFTFTVYYSNGVVKTHSVDITIAGNAQSLAGVHRVH